MSEEDKYGLWQPDGLIDEHNGATLSKDARRWVMRSPVSGSHTIRADGNTRRISSHWEGFKRAHDAWTLERKRNG